MNPNEPNSAGSDASAAEAATTRPCHGRGGTQFPDSHQDLFILGSHPGSQAHRTSCTWWVCWACS